MNLYKLLFEHQRGVFLFQRFEIVDKKTIYDLNIFISSHESAPMKQKFFLLYCQFLARCARRLLKRTQPLVIGIHGSVGKTSCRMIVTQTLQTFLPSKKIYTSPQNYNGELGLPLSLFKIEDFGNGIGAYILQGITILWKSFFMKKSYDIIVLEYGIDHPGEMDFLLSICKPDIGISTALDKVHSEQFGDPQALAKEEVKMILQTKELVFLNSQESYTDQLKELLDIDMMTYSTASNSHDTDISFHHEKLLKKKGRIGTKLSCFVKSHKVKIETNMIGKENYGYISLAFALVEILSYRFHKPLKLQDQELIINYELQPGRLSIFQGINDSILIDSTYNNSPLSLRKTIDTTLWIKRELFPQYKILLVVGDMRELGDFEEQEHRLIA